MKGLSKDWWQRFIDFKAALEGVCVWHLQQKSALGSGLQTRVEESRHTRENTAGRMIQEDTKPRRIKVTSPQGHRNMVTIKKGNS